MPKARGAELRGVPNGARFHTARGAEVRDVPEAPFRLPYFGSLSVPYWHCNRPNGSGSVQFFVVPSFVITTLAVEDPS